MILRPYYYDDHGCAAYVFGCGTLGKCAVVDARIDDVEAYASFATSKNTRSVNGRVGGRRDDAGVRRSRRCPHGWDASSVATVMNRDAKESDND